MKIENVKEIIGDLPYMSLANAKKVEKIFHKYKCRSVLELGFYHGVSTNYMAAILEELGGDRKVTTIDLVSAKQHSPNIEELASKTGLSERIEIFYEERSYLWRLMKLIEEGRKFDFCYLDAGHMWDDTALAFFLVDKLLNDGGLILFDDLNWTAAKGGYYQNWPEIERNTPAVERVWSLLVMPHQNYKEVWIKNNWALARKKKKVPFLPLRY
ncbi:class I SAM-dependent methyltransferase [Kordiimonas pumila]|uniref:Class I SAM-dependent methyltransferase n=1 Tax=Kordiimonas pumila TaxID=2161677 RepID=A0ABV7D912_9PROT|nr:class I SAM-dependent methyltransferase [Kordiimonas pumila]